MQNFTMFELVLVEIACFWIMILAMAFVVKGPRGLVRTNAWMFRKVRGMIGGIFISIGKMIGGGGHGGNRGNDRRRH